MEETKVFAMTHIGCVRKNNQDNFYCNGAYKVMGRDTYKHCENHVASGLYAVFDGMGGLSFGEEASYLAVKALERYQYEHVADHIFDGEDALQYLNEAVCREVRKRQADMGSTAVILEYTDGWVRTYNVGDSKCFLVRSEKMLQLTKDHTEWESMKRIYEKSKMEKCEWGRHVLTQYLGIEEEEFFIEPFISEKIPVKKGDLFLLCSDGLSEFVSCENIKQVLTGKGFLEDKGETLLDFAKKAGGKDNITIVILEM